MTDLTASQSQFDRFELVTGAGEREKRELCVMSFVALLAGERHTDRPATACPVIASYVIKINDAIDCDTRQDLKPLAARIMGTNDGRQRERSWLLARECVNDVFARLLEDAGAPGEVVSNLPRMPLRPDSSIDYKSLSNNLQNIARKYHVPRSCLYDLRYLLRAMERRSHKLVASTAAVLLVDCARLRDGPVTENPYWNKAIAMFSQLCDVGDNARVPVPVVEERLMADANRDRVAETYAPLLLWLFPGLKKSS
jgi:hypothetical protein